MSVAEAFPGRLERRAKRLQRPLGPDRSAPSITSISWLGDANMLSVHIVVYRALHHVPSRT
jgi:hypothetical protein